MTLFFLSAAALLFEINLSRLFSVAQFYHFAFMVVSLALLGYGASGTALALFPSLIHKSARQSVFWLALACGASILASYLLTNTIPFDSFSIAWDHRQILILAIHYIVLTLPFFFNGMVVGMLLAASPQSAGRTYAINLLGSSLGCLTALIAPSGLDGEGVVVLSSGLAFLAALCAIMGGTPTPEKPVLAVLLQAFFTILAPARRCSAGEQSWISKYEVASSGTERPPRSDTQIRFLLERLVLWYRGIPRNKAAWLLAVAGLAFALADAGLRLGGKGGFAFLDLRISPYKSLAYLLQQPGASLETRRWNAFSQVDVVSSSGIHAFPGLSYRYLQPLPAQMGLLIDGDDLSPILKKDADLRFSDYLPAAIAYQLHPQAETLVLGARGGLDVLTALAHGARRVDAIETNPLIIASSPVYSAPGVQAILSDERSYLRTSRDSYDVVVLSLNTAYHPIRSGAYSLAEDYRYTIESFTDALNRLDPGGVLVVTRWLQNPPSEDLRVFALAVETLERMKLDARARIVAFRGYNTATFLVKTQPFEDEELNTIRNFTDERAFDLTYAPGIRAEETNRYNVLPQSIYFQTYQTLLDTQPRQVYYSQYAYDVSPPSDDRPFFGHFFKWSQAGQVLATLGRTWQPFGGAGYFVIVALLILAVVLAGLLILLPLLLTRGRTGEMKADRNKKPPPPQVYLLYFALIGFAYLFVEIPLIQKFILYLGQPSYAMTAILFALLLFSGIGSLSGKRVPLRTGLALLALFLMVIPILIPRLFQITLGLPFPGRLLLTVAVLAPVGFLMGLPFPAGIRQLEANGLSAYVPLGWAVNGSASVVSAVLAALLSLTFGFTRVLLLGAVCYFGAWLIAKAPPAVKASPVHPLRFRRR